MARKFLEEEERAAEALQQLRLEEQRQIELKKIREEDAKFAQ